VIGSGVVVAAGVYIGHNSRLGAASHIYPNVVIYHDVQIGDHCVIHSQAVLGADGFGFARGPDGWEKIHQLGGVRIGNRVEIGASTTVDRGTLDHTVIDDGVIIIWYRSPTTVALAKIRLLPAVPAPQAVLLLVIIALFQGVLAWWAILKSATMCILLP
jgi:hypothetical protein